MRAGIIDDQAGATEYMYVQGAKAQAFLEQNATWQQYIAEPLGKLSYQLKKTFKESENDSFWHKEMQMVLPTRGRNRGEINDEII